MFEITRRTRIWISTYSSNPNPGSMGRIFDLPFTDWLSVPLPNDDVARRRGELLSSSSIQKSWYVDPISTSRDCSRVRAPLLSVHRTTPIEISLHMVLFFLDIFIIILCRTEIVILRNGVGRNSRSECCEGHPIAVHKQESNPPRAGNWVYHDLWIEDEDRIFVLEVLNDSNILPTRSKGNRQDH